MPIMFRTALISICLICSATSAGTPVYGDFKLLASDGASYDDFGRSVSISGDGSTAIVGAYSDDDNGTNSGSAYIYSFVGGVWEETKLLANDGASGDQFGYSVCISSDGTTAIVGAFLDDANGSAYIYSFVSGVWEETKLLASDGLSNDHFGRSVSISGDGTTAIVGAYEDDDNGTDSGSAYIYSLVGGVWEETKLLASDGASEDLFGYSVCISSDGTTAIVGAYEDDDNGSNSGSAYIYSLVNGIWQETKLLASDGASEDLFGESVCISSDGTTAIVGAFLDDDNGTNSGSVYIYSFVGGVWQETKLLASDGGSDDYFGCSVSISSDGTTAIVGAYRDDDNGTDSGSAYIYSFVGGVWQETKLLASDGASEDLFGYSVCISGDGGAIVGARDDDDNGNNSGSAYIFYDVEPVDTDGDGVPDNIDNCYLYNPDQADCNENGIGDVCDVADSTSYDCDQNGVPDECQPDCDGDGWIDPCDNDGDCDDDGIPDNCELDCNENGIPDDCDILYGISQDCNENGVPDECDIADGLEEDCNGNGVPDSCDLADDPSLDCDGDGVFDSCATNDGLVEDCNGNNIPDSCEIDDGTALDCNGNGVPDSCEVNWETKLLASDGASDDYFGHSVSISSDGATAIVGAYEDDDNGTNSGSAYIYSFVSGVWQETKLLASDGLSNDHFGRSVSISGDGTTAIVGAYRDDDNGFESGSAYIYKLVGGVWQETKLLASDGAIYDYFGRSVSISGDGSTAIVGAYSDDDNGSNSGSAYIYSLVKGIWQETKLLASDGGSDDYFGRSVSISSDGTTAIVGAYRDDDNGTNSGSAYIYSLVKGIWQETKLTASGGANDYEFGYSVCISSDGTTAIVGAVLGNDANGSAYIYSFVGGVWQETTLTASDGSSYDNFGESVSISSDGATAIVAAAFDDDNGTNSGSAYIYSFVGGVWQETKLLASDGAEFDRFGYSVSISSDGTTAIVGAYRDDDNGSYSGSAYIYHSPFIYSEDCNANGVPDECDIADGTSTDWNGNGIPDECEVDCNGNGVPDHWDIKTGTSEDCNTNGVPDECDINDGTSTDWNENDIPDECEVDCNTNGYPDDYDIQMGWSDDVNGDGIPDECQCIADITGDNMVDVHDLLAIIGYWGNNTPQADLNQDGIVDVTDLLIVIGNWGPCE